MTPIRNVGIIAHIDAGKTTVTERILFYSEKEHRIGEVDEGTATMDWQAEEQRRGITITAAATTVSWRGYRINLIDTPGHVDFTSEVERCLRVLDGAVGVFCGVSGVQAQSETVWRQAGRYSVPRIAMVNKLDRVGADFAGVLESMRERLRVRPVAMQIPCGEGAEFDGVVDLVERRWLRFDQATQGATIESAPVPEFLADEVERWRDLLLEAAADVDEGVMEKYVEGAEIDDDALFAAIRHGTLTGEFIPTFAGAALRNQGVQPVLDGICRFLPGPGDAPLEGRRPESGEAVELSASAGRPLAALAFKTLVDEHADLVYVRVYQGVLKAGESIVNGRTGRSDRALRLYLMHANSRESVESVSAGNIVAVVGFRETQTGDSLYPAEAPVWLEPPYFPDTVIAMAIEPNTAEDRPKLLQVLERLAREDPTLRFREEVDTGQIVISGMGELHLDVAKNRLLEEFRLDVRVGKPRVAYRQTVRS
ncbi:MAG: GTP-binding protein, partial [Planctomycetota bacterium]